MPELTFLPMEQFAVPAWLTQQLATMGTAVAIVNSQHLQHLEIV
jgi:hypothetical protein